jgi:hypothetical protein
LTIAIQAADDRLVRAPAPKLTVSPVLGELPELPYPKLFCSLPGNA